MRTSTILLLALAACDGKGDDDTAGDTDDDTCDGSPVVLTDGGNYNFEGLLDAPTIVTAEATDLDICWDAVTEDIQGHTLDPSTEIDNLALIRFPHLTEADVEDGLSRNDLQQADISGYVQHNTEDGETCTTLAAFDFFGTPIDVASEYTADGGTYLLLLTTGTTLGVGARMLAFLAPSAESEVTTVDVPPGSDVLDFTADLETLSSSPVCTEGPWEMDWSAITTDGHGNEFDLLTIDKVTLGFYEGMKAADLESQFLDLELIATQMWEGESSGQTTVELDTLSDGASTFSGFAGDGLWVFALQCTRCPNPAPLYLTVLDPEAP